MTIKPPLEKAVVNKILKHLRTTRPDGWWIKTHGDPFQTGGLPDIIGCWRGRFIGFEVKRLAGMTATKRQEKTLCDLFDAGAISAVVTSIEEVELAFKEQSASMGVHMLTDQVLATARIGPKPADNVSVGLTCPACSLRFKPGDYSTLIPLGPGVLPSERQKASKGQTYLAMMLEVHWGCATGDHDPGVEDDE